MNGFLLGWSISSTVLVLFLSVLLYKKETNEINIRKIKEKTNLTDNNKKRKLQLFKRNKT